MMPRRARRRRSSAGLLRVRRCGALQVQMVWGGVALVNEVTTSDRLKKAAWERMKAQGQIPDKDVEAHRRAGRVEKRSIINNAIVRLPDGSYELALQNSAVLQQVFHAH